MAIPRLTVIARLTARPEMADVVKKALLEMVDVSRAEAGCVNYDIFQSNDDPAVFFTYENWVSREALDVHTQTPHFQKLTRDTAEALARPLEVWLMSMISELA